MCWCKSLPSILILCPCRWKCCPKRRAEQLCKVQWGCSWTAAISLELGRINPSDPRHCKLSLWWSCATHTAALAFHALLATGVAGSLLPDSVFPFDHEVMGKRNLFFHFRASSLLAACLMPFPVSLSDLSSSWWCKWLGDNKATCCASGSKQQDQSPLGWAQCLLES